MSRFHASPVVGPLALALTIAIATVARSEPTQFAALTTTSVQTDHMPGELDCLAMNIYWEARSEPRVGQEALAAVTLNRVAHPAFPNTICEVVKQGHEGGHHRCQFSWLCDGRDHMPRESSAWRSARLIAHLALTGRVNDPTGGALWYHSDYVQPAWARHMTIITQIGRHLFYRETPARSRLADADTPHPARLALSLGASENGPMRGIGEDPVVVGASVISVSYASQVAEHGFERSQPGDAVLVARADARTDIRLDQTATERWQTISPLLEWTGKALSSPCDCGTILQADPAARFCRCPSWSLRPCWLSFGKILNAAFANGAPRLMQPLGTPCSVAPTRPMGMNWNLRLRPTGVEHQESLTIGAGDRLVELLFSSMITDPRNYR